MSVALETKIASREETRMSFPWWMEMALVDFRHAFWPWLVYAAAICIPVGESNSFRIQISILLAVCSVFLVKIFSTDFAHGTMTTLLSFPRKRSSLWICRIVTAAVLIAVPLLVFSSNENDFKALVGLLSIGYFSTAALLSLLLRRPLLTWSATFVMPFVYMLIYAMIPGVDQNSSLKDNFPYVPSGILTFNLLGYAIFLFAAWRLWLRLEVRS